MKTIDCMKQELESLKKREGIVSKQINLLLEKIKKILVKRTGFDLVQKEINDKQSELEQYRQKIYDNSSFDPCLLLQIYAEFLSGVYEEDYRFYQTKIPGAKNYWNDDRFDFVTTSRTYENIMYNQVPFDKIKALPDFIYILQSSRKDPHLYNMEVEKLFCNNLFADTKGFELKSVLLENFTYYLIDRKIKDGKKDLNINDMMTYLNDYRRTEEYKETKRLITGTISRKLVLA